ncbi:PRC-barrel domain-containing protein [Glycocaulis sp.]|uniref:PRC-barrel domain-containing protein n=1 Tax=Glycocaulis sp. TaxID=1969725 RepID=UPI003D1E2219
MKMFLKTCTIIAGGALLSPVALAGEPPAGSPDRTQEAREWADDRAEDAGDWASETGDALGSAIMPDRTRLTARTLTSTDLEYDGGSAPIRDLRMSTQGEVEAIIVAHGGFLGVFGDEVQVDAVSATITHDADDGEITVVANVTEADMEAVADGDRSTMSLELVEERSDTALYYSDLSGAEVHGANGEAIAVIRDVELSADGQAEYAVVRDSGFFNMLGETGRIAFSSLSLEHNGDGWEVHARSVTETDIERLTSDDDAF